MKCATLLEVFTWMNYGNPLHFELELPPRLEIHSLNNRRNQPKVACWFSQSSQTY